MEYIPGETLQQKLDRVGPLETPEVLRIGQQIARGLAAAHAQGLIHRDIKPSNILLESGIDLHVKITDFGLARAANDASLTYSGVIAGTPMYMAPEQTQGEVVDHRADLFSLGSVLYTMCSGRPPFRARRQQRSSNAWPKTPRVLSAKSSPKCPSGCATSSPSFMPRIQRIAFSQPRKWAIFWVCLAQWEQGQAVPMGEAASSPQRPILEITPGPVGHSAPGTSRKHTPQQTPLAPCRRGRTVVDGGGLSLTEAAGVTNLRATVIRILPPKVYLSSRPTIRRCK